MPRRRRSKSYRCIKKYFRDAKRKSRLLKAGKNRDRQNIGDDKAGGELQHDSNEDHGSGCGGIIEVMVSIKGEPEDTSTWGDRSNGSSVQERHGTVSEDTGIDDIAVQITVHVKDEEALTDKTENEIAVDVELGNEDGEESPIRQLYDCPMQLSGTHPTSLMETSSSVNKGPWAPRSEVIVQDDQHVHLNSSQQVEGPTGERQRSSVYQVSGEEKQHTNELAAGSKDYDSQLSENSERKMESICTHANSCNCNICLTSFSLKIACNQHQVIQAGEKPFKCQYCEKSFTRKSACQYHEMSHTGEKPFKCQYCEKSFTRKSACQHHERCHTGEKPYKCQFCEKLFSRGSSCKSHEMTHTYEFHFLCQFCGKLFRSKGKCKSHEMGHRIEKLFKCQFCQMYFIQKQQCEIHEMSHTVGKPSVSFVKRHFPRKSTLKKLKQLIKVRNPSGSVL